MIKNYWLLMILVLLAHVAKADPANNNKLKNNTLNFNRNACPTIITDNVSIIPSSCNGSDGKILGISGTGTGTLSFTWYNVNNKIVGTNADLAGVPPGVYKVSLRDESKCLAVELDGFKVPIKNQVVIDNSKTIIKSPDCNQANGSITDITIRNAVSYQWYNDLNKLISSTADLTGVSMGDFKLVATNADGCSTESTYHVPGSGLYPKISRIDTLNALCGDLNQLKITFDLTDQDPLYHYFLRDPVGTESKNGVIVYTPSQPTSITLTLRPDTKFKLITTDPKNCQTILGVYSLGIPIFIIDTSIDYVRNDACGKHTGAVVGLHMIGAHDPRFMDYTWTDASGKVVGKLLELTSVGAGTYTLLAKDKIGGCRDSKTFTITDSTVNATPPMLSNINMCLPGSALISVNNADNSGSYNLYDSTHAFLQTSDFGKFAVNVKQTTQYYVTHTIGSCESPESPITVTVSVPNVEIPNTFTPNNDGVNDVWNLKGFEQFPGITVDIFSRNGAKIFHSDGYAKPFDGTFNRKPLPVGAYYYIIDVHKPVCLGKIAGSITIIR